jgi:hypothetical protein
MKALAASVRIWPKNHHQIEPPRQTISFITEPVIIVTPAMITQTLTPSFSTTHTATTPAGMKRRKSLNWHQKRSVSSKGGFDPYPSLRITKLTKDPAYIPKDSCRRKKVSSITHL